MTRILYCCPWDASDPNENSGYAYSMRAALLARGYELLDLFPLVSRVEQFSLALKVFYKVQSKFYHWDREPFFLRRISKRIDQECERVTPDALFSPSSIALPYLKTRVPAIFSTDQVFASLVNSYVPNPAARYLRLGYLQESAALLKASAAIYPSRWAAEAAVRYHGADPVKVHWIPWGANLSQEPTEGDVLRFLKQRKASPLKLVFIGRQWQRKGGDVVLQTVDELQRRGISCELTIIGTNQAPSRSERLKVIPTLNKHLPHDAAIFQDIMSNAHFLFVPSRAEAYGQVFCEACAFGVPSIATTVGGIPTIIRNGVSGHLLPPTENAAAFADVIARTFSDWQHYKEMALAARDDYVRKLNWSIFGKSVDDVIRSVIN